MHLRWVGEVVYNILPLRSFHSCFFFLMLHMKMLLIQPNRL